MCARRRSNFLSRRQEKVTKEKATPLSASPALRAGATCGARGRGASQNSLRAVALRSNNCDELVHDACVSFGTHATPPAALLGAYRGAGEPTSLRAVAALGPASRAQARRAALRKLRRAKRWPVWLFGCWLLVVRLSTPCWLRLRRGGCGVSMGASAPMPRCLARRSCLNVAAQQRSEFCGAPRNRRDAGRPAAQRRGRRLGVAFLLGTFLWRSKEQVPRLPGRLPASALCQGTRQHQRPGFDKLSPNGWDSAQASTSSARTDGTAPRLRQAQPERMGQRPGFDKLSPNGWGSAQASTSSARTDGAAPRLRQAQPERIAGRSGTTKTIATSA